MTRTGTPPVGRRWLVALATGGAFAAGAVAAWVAESPGLTVGLVVWAIVVPVRVLRAGRSRQRTRPSPPKPPRRRRWDGIFSDYPAPELTPAEAKRGERAARQAAFRAKGSWTLTKRRSYGLYRGDAGDRFLDWPRWRDAYLSEYMKDGPLDLGSGAENMYNRYFT